MNCRSKLEEEIAAMETALAAKKKLLAKANEASTLVIQQACPHEQKRYVGTGYHGSSKGDEWEECLQCGAGFTNGKLNRGWL